MSTSKKSERLRLGLHISWLIRLANMSETQSSSKIILKGNASDCLTSYQLWQYGSNFDSYKKKKHIALEHQPCICQNWIWGIPSCSTKHLWPKNASLARISTNQHFIPLLYMPKFHSTIVYAKSSALLCLLYKLCSTYDIYMPHLKWFKKWTKCAVQKCILFQEGYFC